MRGGQVPEGGDEGALGGVQVREVGSVLLRLDLLLLAGVAGLGFAGEDGGGGWCWRWGTGGWWCWHG